MHGHSPMASFLPSPAAPEHSGTGGAHAQHGVRPARCVQGLLLPARPWEGLPAEPWPGPRPAPTPRPAPPPTDSSPRRTPSPRPAQTLRPAPPPDSSPRPGPASPSESSPRPTTRLLAMPPAPPPPHRRLLTPTPPLRLLSPPPPLLVQRGPLALVTGETREDISVVAGPGGRGRGGREPHVCGPGRRVGQSTAVRTRTVARGPPAPPSTWWPPGSESGNPLLITARVSAPNKICGPPPSFADTRPQAHTSPAAVRRGGPALLTLHTSVLSSLCRVMLLIFLCSCW